MGIAERREREREALRTRIKDAALEIVSEQGLDALSMRSIAELIEYSPATIYLYFRDKDELLREVMGEGFRRLGEYMRAELDALGPDAAPDQQYRAIGRGYVNFALENTAYLRVMFELPSVAQMDCPECTEEDLALIEERPGYMAVDALQRAIDAGLYDIKDAVRGALVGWGLVHGLTTLYLSGHLLDTVSSREEFMSLVDEAMSMLRMGWAPRETPSDMVT